MKIYIHVKIMFNNHFSFSHRLKSEPKFYPQILHKSVIFPPWVEPIKL